MGDHRIVVSVREFEQVKLLIFELQHLCQRLSDRGQPEAEDLLRIIRRFTDVDLTDDRA